MSQCLCEVSYYKAVVIKSFFTLTEEVVWRKYLPHEDSRDLNEIETLTTMCNKSYILRGNVNAE